MINLKESPVKIFITGDYADIQTLVETFKFRPNGYFYAPSFQRWRLSKGKEGWDGYLCPVRYEGVSTWSIPRGRKGELFQALEMEKIKVGQSNLLKNPFEDLEIDDVRPDLLAGKFQLDIRQRHCILEWVKAAVGFAKISVGGGKTACFAGAAAFIREISPNSKFIYITPSERLVSQSSKELKAFLPHMDVGQYGGGKKEKDAKDIVVCTVAILSRNFNTLVEEGWFSQFTTILYDETHHAASPSSQKVLEQIPAYFRLGASDTAKENDPVKFNAIRNHFGVKLMQVESKTLIDIGRLATPNIYVVDIPEWKMRFDDLPHKATVGSAAFVLSDGKWLKGKYKGSVYQVDPETGEIEHRPYKTALVGDDGKFITEMRPVIVPGLHLIELDGEDYEIESRWCLLDRTYDRAVIQYKPRNDLVVEWSKFFSDNGYSTIVVAKRTTHVYILEALLKQAVNPSLVNILTGYEGTSPTQRDKMFKWFKDTPGAVLVTPLVKEGISINEIRAMVVADHCADFEVARQIVGRALRPKSVDNRAHIVWFWDRQHSALSKGCRNVLEHLQAAEGFNYHHPCSNPISLKKKIRSLL